MKIKRRPSIKLSRQQSTKLPTKLTGQQTFGHAAHKMGKTGGQARQFRSPFHGLLLGPSVLLATGEGLIFEIISWVVEQNRDPAVVAPKV
jgi:hypothetical protein